MIRRLVNEEIVIWLCICGCIKNGTIISENDIRGNINQMIMISLPHSL